MTPAERQDLLTPIDADAIVASITAQNAEAHMRTLLANYAALQGVVVGTVKVDVGFGPRLSIRRVYNDGPITILETGT